MAAGDALPDPSVIDRLKARRPDFTLAGIDFSDRPEEHSEGREQKVVADIEGGQRQARMMNC
jgi:hypothetical protein